MTQKGETLGFSMADHLQTISDHVGEPCFDIVLCNHSTINEKQRADYRQENASQIKIDVEALAKFGVRIVSKDLLADDEKVRHDPHKLAFSIFEVCNSAQISEALPSSIIQSQS